MELATLLISVAEPILLLLFRHNYSPVKRGERWAQGGSQVDSDWSVLANNGWPIEC